MSPLHRKLFRDILHLKGQVTALSLVVACGVASYVTMHGAYLALLHTRDAYYEQLRFAHVFSQVRRAPESLASRLAVIPGIRALETRIVRDALLDVPNLDEPATGRFISIPATPRSQINGIFLRRGRYIDPARRSEVLVSEAFFIANQLNIGDRIGAILNGRWQTLDIVGVALSPEYVYEIRGTEVLPDNRRFGVFWMHRDALAAAFDLKASFNDVVVELDPNMPPRQVIAALDHLLTPFGSRGAFDREEQTSHRFLSDEIAQDRVTGIVIPAIFLGVAAFLIHLVLSRLVATQRAEIGALKAFGYSHWDVARFYVEFGALAVTAGSIAGIALGIWLGRGLANLYAAFFRFPELLFTVDRPLLFTALGISYSAALAGALLAARGAASLPPAEAMRPESPPRYHAGWLESVHLALHIPLSLRMIIRGLSRRKMKALLSVTGIGFAVAIVICGRFFLDSMDWILDVQFTQANRQHVALWLHNPSSRSVQHSIQRFPSVIRAEPFRLVVVRLVHEHRRRNLAIFGVSPDATLSRIVDRHRRHIRIPPQGLLISQKLAEVLQIAPGQLLTVEVMEGNRPTWRVPVAATVNDLIGLFAYMDITALQRLMQEDGVTSGAYLQVDTNHYPPLYRAIRRTPSVSGILLLESMKDAFQKTIAENMNISVVTLVTFACVIAFGMVYNSARISLAERGHELASLRVLGFTHREIAFLLLGEQAVLLALAIPTGFAIGYALAAAIVTSMATELFRIPVIVAPRTYAFAFLIVLAAAAFSSVFIILRLRRLDLVAVLKTRE